MAVHLGRIRKYFLNSKIALLVRAPDLADGDFLMTDDGLDEAIAKLQRLKAKEPAPRITSRVISCRRAPSAMRMPISCVRRASPYDNTP